MGPAETLAADLVRATDLPTEGVLLDVLAGLPDPVLVLDAEARVLWGNRAAEAFFGRSIDTSVGLPGLDFVHPDDLELALISLVSVQTNNAPLPIEVRLRTTLGWRLTELVGAPLRSDPAGAVVLSIRDLTERRSLEVAIDDIGKFRSMVHNAATLTMLVSPEGTVEAASGALARLLGQDPTAVVGEPLAALVQPSDRAALEETFLAASLSPPGAARPLTVEVRLWHRSKRSAVPFELTIVNLLEDLTVGGFVVSGHDLTSRKVIEGELLSALSLLSATLDSTGDGILVVDLEGAITRVNKQFLELWKVPKELIAAKDDAAAIEFVLDQLENPDAFVAKVAELYADPDAESHDVLHFLDGRVFDRFSQPQYIDGAVVGRVWSFRDSTERSRLERELSHQALHDPLTNLANQNLFRDRVERALARADHGGGGVAVLFLDLDNFKTVNDSLGHSAGDLLLIGVTERLEGCLRGSATAARLGGDEFAVLLEEVANEHEVIQVAHRLLAAFKRTFTIDATDVSATVSIGVAFAAPGVTCGQLLRNADLAMYTAKRGGKGRFETFESEMHAVAVSRLHAEAELRHAIEADELTPRYQPIFDLVSGRVVGAEALARWCHPVRGLLAAEAFIMLAEETGLIEDISQLVLGRACADLRHWQDTGIADAEFAVCVNVAPRQMVGEALVGDVVDALATHGLDPSGLILEITEGAMMLDTAAASANVARLRSMGVRIALDDFGTGYSSLAYLQRFPVDILKIDKSFVEHIDSGPEHSVLPDAIIGLARTLNLTTIAEGVERETQRDRLRELGCERAQGYYFAEALAADAIVALLRTSQL